MTLTELRYIVALAEEHHFGRAAERCHVSQPTLSIAVKKLEEELGAVLFERGKQRALVTPLGARIVALANGVLEQTSVIKDTAAADADQLQAPLALGTLPSIGPYLLPQFIPLLQGTAGGLSLYVEEGSLDTLAPKLRSGELDALLITAPYSEPDIVTQPLFDEPFVMLLPANHKLAHKSTVSIADVDPAEVLLLSEGHRFREQVLEAFPHLRPRAIAPIDEVRRSTIRGSTLETLRHMVGSGLGVTILPQTAAEAPIYAPNLLVTRAFDDPAPTRSLLLAWRVSFPRHKAIDVLRRAIQASSGTYWRYNTAPVHDAPGVLVENRNW